MKKHQLFKNRSYVQIKISDHLIVIGQVIDSTIVKPHVSNKDPFGVPYETILIDSFVMFDYGHGYKQLYAYYLDFMLFAEIIDTNKILKNVLFRSKDGEIRVKVEDLSPVSKEEYKVEYRRRRSLESV